MISRYETEYTEYISGFVPAFLHVYMKTLYVSCHMQAKVLYCSLYFVHVSDAYILYVLYVLLM